MYTKTERTFINVNSGEKFSLYYDCATGKNKLIRQDGFEFPGFITNQSPFPIQYRHRDGYEFTLPSGYFLPIYKGAKVPTHFKYPNQKRFKKL